MSLKAYTKARASQISNNPRLFHGKNAWYPVSNPATFLALENNVDLWFFEFTIASHRSQINEKTNQITQYIGVFDIDFQGSECLTEEERKYMVEQRTLPSRIQPIVKRIVRNDPYQVFFSGKKGIHIYLINEKYYVKASRFVDIKAYFRNVLYKDDPSIVEYFDESIYHKGKGIRPYSCRHKSTHIIPIPLESSDQYFNDTFWYFLGDIVLKNTPFNLLNQYQQPLRDSREGIPIQNKQPTITIIDENDELIDWIKNDLKNKDKECNVERYTIKNNLVVFQEQKYCYKKEDFHSGKYKCYWVIYSDRAVQMCHSHSCSSKTNFVVKKNVDALSKIPDLYFPYFKSIKEIPSSQQYVLDEDIEEGFSKSNILLILAAMGSGKSFALNKVLEKLDHQQEEATILIVSTRIVQSNYFAFRYKNVENYLDCKDHEDIIKSKRLVICLNSLPRIVDRDQIPVYDYLILDEIDNIVKTITSPMSNFTKFPPKDIWRLLLVLIKTCKKVIMMDGIPSDLLFHYLKKTNIMKSIHAITHHKQPDERFYLKIQDPFMFQNMLLRYAVQMNKKCVFVSNTKNSMRIFHESLALDNHKKCLIIDGDSSREEKNTASDPNCNWEDYDVLFYNSAVGPGPSFDKYTYDCMFVYCEPTIGADPIDMYQLINRIRILRDGKAYIYIKATENVKPPPTYYEIKKKACERVITFNNKQKNYFDLDIVAESDSLKMVNVDVYGDPQVLRTLATESYLKWRVSDDVYLSVWARREQRQITCKSHDAYYDLLKNLIVRNGAFIKECEVQENLNSREQKFNKFHSSMLAKRKREKCKELALVPKSIDIERYDYRTVNKLIDLNNYEKHRYYQMMREMLSLSDKELYERDFKKVDHGGVPLVNMVQYSIVAEKIKKILLRLDLQYEKKHGYIEGRFTTNTLMENYAELFHLESEIVEEMEKMTKIDISLLKNNLQESRQNNFNNLKKTLGLFSFHIKTVDKKRQVINGQRQQYSIIEVMKESIDFRNCLRGLQYDTLEYVGKHEALLHLLNSKYTII